jgi:protocatechuate 3,4-dioxygenase beta subunit
MQPTRRDLLRAALGIGAAATTGAAWAEALREPTPFQTIGPFYPVTRPLDADADLTVIEGGAGRAEGQVIHVMGRVLDARGAPVAGAKVEIWQANAKGRYAHPADRNPAPLDPNFQGFGAQLTDGDGQYRFKMNPQRVRPPHIHFDVSGRDARLVTQMYFPGEPANAGDLIFGGLGADEQRAVTASVSPPGAGLEPDSLLVRWDIVLVGG